MKFIRGSVQINMRFHTFRQFGLIIIMFFCGVCEVAAESLYLKNGDRVTGQIIEESEDQLKVKTDIFGEVVLLRDMIDHVDKGTVPSAVETKPVPPKVLENTLSVSYAATRGNSDSKDAAVSLNTRHKKGRNEWAIQSTWEYGSDNKKMTTQKFFNKAQSDYFLGETSKWFWTRAVESSHDRFNNIHFRIVPSSGVGYRFWDNEDSRVLADTALGYEYTDYREGAKSEGSFVIVPHVYLSKALFWRAVFAQDLTFYPSLENADDYRLRSVSSLTCPINDVLSWKLSFTDEFSSMPKGSAKKNDSTLMASLAYMF